MKYIQIYIKNFEFPFIVIESIFSKSNLIMKILESPIVKIKKFLGSDFNINGSGFLFFGKDNSKISVEYNSKDLKNFKKSMYFKILNINDYSIKENISIEINLYRNTNDDTTIAEFCFSQFNESNYAKWVRDKLFDLEIKKYFQNFCIRLKKYILNSSSSRNINLYHSLLINTNYEDAYKLFKDFNNTAKVLGTDKLWEIKFINNLNNSTYSVNMNNGVSIDYKIKEIEIENINDIKSLLYHKIKDNIPALNEWTKVDFYKISNNKCLLIHETKIPENISSSLYNTIDNFTLYVLIKLKKLIESNNTNL